MFGPSLQGERGVSLRPPTIETFKREIQWMLEPESTRRLREREKSFLVALELEEVEAHAAPRNRVVRCEPDAFLVTLERLLVLAEPRVDDAEAPPDREVVRVELTRALQVRDFDAAFFIDR